MGAAGQEIIYFGDHLPADVMECSRHSDWRTCLIVPELREEIDEATDKIEENSFDSDITVLKQKLLSQNDKDSRSLFRFQSIVEVKLQFASCFQF